MNDAKSGLKCLAMGQEGIRVAGWVRVVETQRGNEAVIRFLVNSSGGSISGQDKICEVLHEHFAEVSGGGGILGLRVFLDNGTCLLVYTYEFYRRMPDLLKRLLASVYVVC